MRKLFSYQENPLDNLFIKISEYISPILFKSGHTPNIITTYSFLLGLLSLKFLYEQKRIHFAYLFLLSYFFDCLDGYFARRYNMVTEFGDFYDHLTDISIPIGICIILIHYYIKNEKVLTLNQIGILIIILLLLYLSLVHIGCQQKQINSDQKETLDNFKVLCPNKESILISKFVGSGTLVLYISIIIGLDLI